MNRDMSRDVNRDMDRSDFHPNNSTTRALSWIIALFGVWQLISPFVLGYNSLSAAATTDAIIFGALLIIFGVVSALVRTGGPAMTLNWLNALIGIWLIISPFVLGFSALSEAAEVSFVIVGIVALILGVIAALAVNRYYRAHEMGTGRMGSVPVTGMSDDNIHDTIVDRLNQDPGVDANGINVIVNHGDVTLRGSVPSSEQRQLAENDAQNVAGVRNVKDDLRVM